MAKSEEAAKLAETEIIRIAHLPDEEETESAEVMNWEDSLWRQM